MSTWAPDHHPTDGRRKIRVINGILNVDKPTGMTSMDMVRRIKRVSRQKRVGHGGTLDPIASGVIPVCLGQATRMMEYLISSTKDYRATIELGIETDTYDTEGQVTVQKDSSLVSLQDVEQALASFKGNIEQVPPMYSALKRRGKRLYELARVGIEVEREPRKVVVSSIRIRDWTPPSLTVDVTCGRGFYMRSLAHDLGQAIGCGGHLKTLVRRRTGPFEISGALSLEDVERIFCTDSWEGFVHAPDVVVRDMRAAIVGERLAEMIKNGRQISPSIRIPPLHPDEQCRVYTTNGRFIAIISFNASSGQWNSERVFTQLQEKHEQ